MTKQQKAQVEVELAITALFQEAGRFNDLVWSIQLAPPPAHPYHRPEHMTGVLDSFAKCQHSLKVLVANLKKMVAA